MMKVGSSRNSPEEDGIGHQRRILFTLRRISFLRRGQVYLER